MIARSAICAAVLLAVPAVAALAPVEGRVYRLVTTTDRDDGVTRRHYTLTRDVVFRRTADGFLAEVTLRAGTSDDTGAGGFYARALTRLAGTALRFRLDSDGRVVAIDDLDTAWERLASAVDSMAAAPASQATSARRMGDLLRALPPAKRQAMLASIVAPLTQSTPAAGKRTIAITGDAIDGRSRHLAGEEVATRLPSGLLEIRRTATDDAAAPTITLSSRRTLDPATGLLLTSEEQRILTVAGAPDRRLVVTDHVTLTPLVS